MITFVDPRKNCRSSQPKIVACPICGETVAGQRFAPHLEKCINGGKRGGGLPKKSFLPTKGSSQSAGFHLPYYTAPRKIDPHPSSLVIRIRLKDGGSTRTWFLYLPLSWNCFWSVCNFIHLLILIILTLLFDSTEEESSPWRRIAFRFPKLERNRRCRSRCCSCCCCSRSTYIRPHGGANLVW